MINKLIEKEINEDAQQQRENAKGMRDRKKTLHALLATESR